MMRIDIISAVPESLESPINTSIVKRAQNKGKVEIVIHNLRDYAYDKHKQIDDKPFGGGPGMLLKPEPFFECIEKLQSERTYEHIIITTPKGKLYDQGYANKLSLGHNIMILAGHYKGIDDRVRERFVTDEISIGNFVLSGGELPALIILDSIVRLVPGVLNDSESALNDTFMDGEYLEPPYYTRPAEYRGMKVPQILLSGNDKKIREWKEEESKVLTEKWKKINSVE
ncbi:MAG: tRNA (guanosine(37)-N1)-methyltransferase TrmD [Melioribacteraceae bacterium]|nr:tRNA (guanosine(37)-N1)-methyltransferase TrmD [Melioribacteraceae bacterium]MCF8356692.1 tRNA (guanosine(37)-N1)-methyltransferase TrmD [Melioribacteraceae bacterium]MCF8393870.1 tRNA (guanosine(37)-N1)-methyltransferase TrmD [Melioribacteraceae bacterium]MCF8418243.1 tRNA (guanosine(37)-N1)-methyltransferase TrmD [Melioribacteraceae bacterium]